MWRFLPGIIIVQIATGVLVLVTINTTDTKYLILFGLFASITSILAAFWFSSIASHLRKDEITRAKETFARERENLRVRAEKEKTKVIQRSQKQVEKEASRIHGKANLKVGASIMAAVGAGILMLITELLTLGLLTISTVSGGLAGYALRARQSVGRDKKEQIRALHSGTSTIEIIDAGKAGNESSRLEKIAVWRKQ